MNDRRLPGAVEMSTSCLTLHPSLHSGQTCAFCGWRPERGSDETATPGQVAANLASRATVPHAATALLALQNAAQEAWVLVPEETRTILRCLLRAYDVVPRTRHGSDDPRGDQTTETAPGRESKNATLADLPSPQSPEYEEGGWIREGTLAICPECKAPREGTASWFLLHEKGCMWKPSKGDQVDVHEVREAMEPVSKAKTVLERWAVQDAEWRAISDELLKTGSLPGCFVTIIAYQVSLEQRKRMLARGERPVTYEEIVAEYEVKDGT